MLEHLSDSIQWVCCTIEDHDTNRNVLRMVKENRLSILVFCLGRFIDEAEDLYEYGADYVLIPHMSGAHLAWSVLQDHLPNPGSLIQLKNEHRSHLKDHKQWLA